MACLFFLRRIDHAQSRRNLFIESLGGIDQSAVAAGALDIQMILRVKAAEDVLFSQRHGGDAEFLIRHTFRQTGQTECEIPGRCDPR